jgi:hypothetical protein
MSGISIKNFSPLVSGSVSVTSSTIEGEAGGADLITAATGKLYMLIALTVQCDGGTPTYRINLTDATSSVSLVLGSGTVTTSEVLFDLSKLNAPIYIDSNTKLDAVIDGSSEGVVNTFKVSYVEIEAS